MVKQPAVVVLIAGACVALAACQNTDDARDLSEGRDLSDAPDLAEPPRAQLGLVVQVVNDNGGTATASDFSVGADGPTPLAATVAAASGTELEPGTYTLDATSLAAYAAQGWTCVGVSLEAGNKVTLAAGVSATCTITHDDVAPVLTLEKQVTNDNGGTAQPSGFLLTATGPSTVSGNGTVASGASFLAGSYTLSSSTLPGYSAGAWSCVGATLGPGDAISLGIGESAVCSITDDDVAPSLTLVAQVFNDNAGTAAAAAFTLTATGPTPISGPGGATSGASFAQGVYALSDSGPTGYAPSAWSCSAGSLTGNMLTLAVGETAVCSLTEDDLLVPLVEPSNTVVTTAAGVQQQPSVAVDPLDAQHVAIAYMDYALRATGYAGIALAASTDGGASWTKTEVPVPAAFNAAAGSPVARFHQGKLYVVFMAATFEGPNKPGLIYDPRTFTGLSGRSFGMQADNGIFIASTVDDGANWGTTVAIASNLYTSPTKVPFETTPDLAIDEASGNLYVTWARFYPAGLYPGRPTSLGGSAIMLARSADGGQSWTTLAQAGGAPVILDPVIPNANQAAGSEGNGVYTNPRVSVGPEGDVYVSAWVSARIVVWHSTDQGATFQGPSSDATDPSGKPFGLQNVPGGVTPAQAFNPAGTLLDNAFRTLPMRAIAADPARPGYVYFVEATMAYLDDTTTVFDAGSIHFARSTDYGVTWSRLFTLGGQAPRLGELAVADQPFFRSPLNDDDGNRFLPFHASLTNEVVTGQALPELSVDAQGNIAVLWYDTRRDPGDHNLDVFATISTDGGLSFRANHRVTSLAFDPSSGAFVDARAATSFHLGDRLGLALAGGNIYAAWTDTLAGNQEIVMSRSVLSPSPATPNDRYEPNELAAQATALGSMSVSRVVPRLLMVGGEEDWFRFTVGLSGTLTASVIGTGGEVLVLELWDVTATTLLATGAAITDGRQVSFAVTASEQFLVRVRKQPSATAVEYTLSLGL
jgi:hypothetical protein